MPVWGEAYTTSGQYDQALSSFLNALDIYRRAGDTRGAANVSALMGLVFVAQGRYGAAVNSVQDAVKAFRDLGDRSRDMAGALNELGGALGKAGRGNEAAQPLSEAHTMAQELKNDSLMAAIANNRADIARYRGDLKAAKDFYQQAVPLATRDKAWGTILAAQLGLARIAIAEGRSREAIAALTRLKEQAQSFDKGLAIRCSVALSEALARSKDYTRARPELESALRDTEKAGMRLESASIYFLLGEITRLSGKEADSADVYRQTLRLLDNIQKEPGARTSSPGPTSSRCTTTQSVGQALRKPSLTPLHLS